MNGTGADTSVDVRSNVDHSGARFCATSDIDNLRASFDTSRVEIAARGTSCDCGVFVSVTPMPTAVVVAHFSTAMPLAVATMLVPVRPTVPNGLVPAQRTITLTFHVPLDAPGPPTHSSSRAIDAAYASATGTTRQHTEPNAGTYQIPPSSQNKLFVCSTE